MERMVNWFTEVLGFQQCPVSDDAHGSIVSLVQDGCRLLLHSGPKPSSLDYLGESNTLVVFEVEDLDKAVEQLKRRGVEFASKKPQNFHLGRFVTFRDPFGNERELVEFRR
jgi:uncharacterized glyoxalase superfamily protein PhnB